MEGRPGENSNWKNYRPAGQEVVLLPYLGIGKRGGGTGRLLIIAECEEI